MLRSTVLLLVKVSDRFPKAIYVGSVNLSAPTGAGLSGLNSIFQ